MKLNFLPIVSLLAVTAWSNPTYPSKNSGSVKQGPFEFTSVYNVVATPGQVVNDTGPTGGLKGAKGYFNFGINSKLNYICWNIRLEGFRGEYESPALSATHIHEAARGKAGPPRITFKNPRLRPGGERTTYGCKAGPFTTGLTDEDTGKDTGIGFHVKQIEQNPKAFFTDVHSSLAVPGAVRGQLG